MEMIKKGFIFWLGILWNTASFAQKNTPQQLMVISENDCYTSLSNDGYYTNGIKLTYQWLKERADSSSKTIFNNIELGQFIYNAEDGHYTLSKLDRPVTGYLYGGYQQKIFNKRENMLRWGIFVGSIGSLSLGQQVQEFIHKSWRIYEPVQWKYQLNKGLGVTATVLWSPQITHNREKKKFDMKPVAGASLGNMFSNAMIGYAFLVGRFNSNSSTAFWDNHREQTKGGREFFFYLYPALYVQAYNATVQGNMFNKKPEIYLGKLNPAFLQVRAGFTYAIKKLSLGYAAVYENKQSLTQRSKQIYGSIQLGFRW